MIWAMECAQVAQWAYDETFEEGWKRFEVDTTRIIYRVRDGILQIGFCGTRISSLAVSGSDWLTNTRVMQKAGDFGDGAAMHAGFCEAYKGAFLVAISPHNRQKALPRLGNLS